MKPMDEETEDKIIDLYINQKLTPKLIAEMLGFKYFQPVYNLLKRREVFEKHYTGQGIQRKYQVNEGFFEEINSEEKAYILGFIAADGYVDETRNALKISLNEKDVDVLVKIRDSLSSTHPIRHFVKDGKFAHVSIDIGSKKIVQDLKRLGLYSGKSLTMTGDIIQAIPNSWKRDFLRGYFDGDGCISYGKKYSSGVKFNLTVVGTEDFLVKTFNIFCNTNVKISKYKSCNMYKWSVASKLKVDQCLDYLYKGSNIYLDRKYDQYLKSKFYSKECAHVKLGELLEPLTLRDEGNQQPSLRNKEGSETIEKQS